MNKQRIFSAVVLTVFMASLLFATQQLPRKSPELVFTQPNGKEVRLSSYQGKVVVVEFFFVRSPHCLQLVQTLDKLNHELASRGFQPVAVAFGPNSDAAVLGHLVDYFKVTYPIGYTTADKVDAYLGRDGKQILKIPQMVILDRNGIIRATSGSEGNPTLENEASLHDLIKTLLAERPSVRGTARRDESQ